MSRVFILLVLVLPSWTYAADPQNQVRDKGLASVKPGPPLSYCGMYCLYLAAHNLGSDMKFSELLKPEYIGSRLGSSLFELIYAASELGLNAKPMTRMTSEMLFSVRCPLILHVKSDISLSKEYNHWVLFMGTEGGKARIYDGIRPLELVDVADLVARWDGVGLLIDKTPISLTPLWLVVVAQFVFYTGVCAGFIALLLWLQQFCIMKFCWAASCRTWRRCICELVVMLVLALALGASFRAVHAGGFLSHAPDVAAIQDMHLGGFLTKVKAEDVPNLLAAGDVTLVDARFPQAFTAGHLANAINIPPNLPFEQYQQALAGVPSSNRILLYCESSGCPYSPFVARKLIALGYSNILYFRDGWVAWESYQQSTEP